MLVLSVVATDADVLTPYGMAGELVLYYGTTNNGWSDRFNVMDGKQTDSTFVRLNMSKTNGVPRLTISGWQGRQVSIETSSNLLTWAAYSTVSLDTNGQATATCPSTPASLFLRGRLVGL
ncbi:MAG: hypothetical protein EPO07_13285 [Verrucomicrobia bacterium]|nr:MAG: hypothetical protein EPO07_13285 [Verrucomicrobiota bacterium]